MIKEFVQQWDEKKGLIREALSKTCPNEYKDLVVLVATIMNKGKTLDPKSVFEFCGSDYQGSHLYVIRGSGDYYQRDCFYTVKVDYGSCSGCDTLEHLKVDLDGEEQLDGLMTLCLHIVQEIKEA